MDTIGLCDRNQDASATEGVLIDMDKITFEITWAGSQEGLLFYLIHNDRVIPLATNEEEHKGWIIVGRGRVRVVYEAARASVHRLEWSLMFPGRTLSDVEVSVSVNGGEPQKKSPDGDPKHHWVGAMDL